MIELKPGSKTTKVLDYCKINSTYDPYTAKQIISRKDLTKMRLKVNSSIIDEIKEPSSVNDNMPDDIVFTPASVLDLLLQIEELQDLDIGMDKDNSGNIIIKIGDSTYQISTDSATDIKIPEEAVYTIQDTNEDTYNNILQEEDITDEDINSPIEGGIVKDALKSLMLGGMIRFAGKHLIDIKTK